VREKELERGRTFNPQMNEDRGATGRELLKSARTRREPLFARRDFVELSQPSAATLPHAVLLLFI
jgi:hypothetical protein